MRNRKTVMGSLFNIKYESSLFCIILSYGSGVIYIQSLILWKKRDRKKI